MKNAIKQYVAERNKAVCDCWLQKSLEPLTEFIETHNALYEDEFNLRWDKANEQVKWLTLCKMTFGITSKKVAKYRMAALEKRLEIINEVKKAEEK